MPAFTLHALLFYLPILTCTLKAAAHPAQLSPAYSNPTAVKVEDFNIDLGSGGLGRGLLKSDVAGSKFLRIVETGNVYAVKRALRRGADPNYRSNLNGFTPLLVAIQNDYGELVSLLISEGADVDQATVGLPTDYGALQWACNFGSTNAARQLLAAGVPVDGLNEVGLAALEYCAQNGWVMTAMVLVEAGADVDLAGKGMYTPLYTAAHEDHLAMVEFLMSKRADPEKKSGSYGFTPIFGAVFANSRIVIKGLLAGGADVDAQAIDKRTPLWVAAFLGQKDALTVLMENGADNTISAFQQTPRQALCQCIGRTRENIECNEKQCADPKNMLKLLT